MAELILIARYQAMQAAIAGCQARVMHVTEPLATAFPKQGSEPGGPSESFWLTAKLSCAVMCIIVIIYAHELSTLLETVSCCIVNDNVIRLAW